MHHTRKLQIDGMSCGHCVERVRSTFESMEGVRVLEVEIGSAHLEFDPEQVDESRLAAAIRDAGFQPR